MTADQWQIIITALVGGSGFVTYLVSRRHDENVEDSDAHSRAIAAITAATITLVAPLTLEVERLSRNDIARQATLERHERRLKALSGYVKVLQHQIVDLGASPHPAPPDLEGFIFD